MLLFAPGMNVVASLFALSIVFVGCASMVDRGVLDGGPDATTSDSSFVCPADPSTLIGHACHSGDPSCGRCTDPCSFCNVVQCSNGTWTGIEGFPEPCDGSQPIDAATIACGDMTCSPGQLCVHTLATGGPCRQPEDGGCGPGETLSGSCCTFRSDNYRCATAPANCETNITCGCAQSMCDTDAGPSCPCSSANSTHVECACLYP